MTGASLLAGSGMPWLLALGVIGGAIATLIKAWSVLRKVELDAAGERFKVKSDGDNVMLTQALARIASLEARITDLEKNLGREQAQRGVLEHQLAQESHSLDMLLMLARNDPDRIVELLPQIEEARDKGRQRIALEKGAMAGAQIGGAA